MTVTWFGGVVPSCVAGRTGGPIIGRLFVRPTRGVARMGLFVRIFFSVRFVCSYGWIFLFGLCT